MLALFPPRGGRTGTTALRDLFPSVPGTLRGSLTWDFDVSMVTCSDVVPEDRRDRVFPKSGNTLRGPLMALSAGTSAPRSRGLCDGPSRLP